MRFVDVFIKVYLNFEIILYNLPLSFCFVCPKIDSDRANRYWTSGVEIAGDQTRVLIDGSNGTTSPLNLCILPDNLNGWGDTRNRLTLALVHSEDLGLEFFITEKQYPALCQIDPDAKFPYCPAEFLLLNGKCFHIAKCETTYENAKQLCAAISSPSGHNSAKLFSDFSDSSNCTKSEVLRSMFYHWNNDAQYCGECCHEQTTATCFLEGSYTLESICNNCTCSTCKPLECCLDETNSTVRNGAGMSGSCVKPGELININCEPGYHPGGAMERVMCMPDGQWSSLVPNCKAATYIWKRVRYTRYKSPVLGSVMVGKLVECTAHCYNHPRCLSFNFKIQSGGAECEMLDDQPKDMVRGWEFDHYKILYEVFKNDKRQIQIEL